MQEGDNRLPAGKQLSPLIIYILDSVWSLKWYGQTAAARPVIRDSRVLQSLASVLSGTDPDGVLNVVDEDLSVTVISRVDLIDDRIDDGIRQFLWNHGFHLYLWKQVHIVFGAPVHLRIPLLIAVAHDIADHDAVDPAAFQNRF